MPGLLQVFGKGLYQASTPNVLFNAEPMILCCMSQVVKHH